MTYTNFKNKVRNLPVIFAKNVVGLGRDRQIVRNQLRRWRQRGLIIKLRRGVYILNENDRKINPSKQFIANQLYSPSYVSLEYALSFYDLIPERVYDITSITTKKTTRFVNKFGVFTYQHVKPGAFRGFIIAKDESGLVFFIAKPEKAIVDFLYLNLHRFKSTDEDIFENSYRFQNTEGLNPRSVKGFTSLFNNHKLARFSELFCDFMKRKKR
jgi:hypothetical protein